MCPDQPASQLRCSPPFTELTFVFLQIVKDVVDGSHGLVHQLVQLVGGGAGVARQLLQSCPSSGGVSPGSSGPQAWLPVGRGEREEIINAGLGPVPLGRQVVHFVPVDLPGGEGRTDQQQQQQQQEGKVMSAIRISGLVSGSVCCLTVTTAVTCFIV